MNGYAVYTEQESKLRAEDKDLIVRSWTQSPVLRDVRGDITGENPAFHNPICQKEDGAYCNEAGTAIPRKNVPAYIIAEGAPPQHSSKLKVSMTLSQAMAQSMEPEANINVPPPVTKRGRGRPRKAA